jgi:hypothetical protein
VADPTQLDYATPRRPQAARWPRAVSYISVGRSFITALVSLLWTAVSLVSLNWDSALSGCFALIKLRGLGDKLLSI